jgi:hypothetical protein
MLFYKTGWIYSVKTDPLMSQKAAQKQKILLI